MANNTTQPYNRSLSGSVGAGLSSIVKPGGRKYFILEHKVSSKYHRAGENQEIIVNQIELGRDPHCQVRFDESFSTVSRRHAAITKDGDNWKIVPLSKTNTTLLNGRPIKNEWYLQNGDEIQLSVNGPKLGFIVPTGNKATVGTIGLTRRLSLFRQQALRPYKNAIAILSIILILSLLGGGYKLYDVHQQNKHLDGLVAQSLQEQERLRAANDSIAQAVVAKSEVITDMQSQISNLSASAGHISPTLSTRVGSMGSVSKGVDNNALKSCDRNVFFIMSLGFEVILPTGESFELECGGDSGLPSWTGTGFMLNDGRFVTARHVVEPWYFLNSGGKVDEQMLMLNIIAHNGGKVVAHLGAVSNSGEKFTFTSTQCHTFRYGDETYASDEGEKIVVASANAKDFATINTGRSGGLQYDIQASRNLERGTKLAILGFPLGLGASSSGINPIYGSAVVAADGLQNGMILTTETTYEHGCSGGPVFYTDSHGNLVVIGITSAIAGRSTGFVEPISSIN